MLSKPSWPSCHTHLGDHAADLTCTVRAPVMPQDQQENTVLTAVITQVAPWAQAGWHVLIQRGPALNTLFTINPCTHAEHTEVTHPEAPWREGPQVDEDKGARQLQPSSRAMSVLAIPSEESSVHAARPRSHATPLWNNHDLQTMQTTLEGTGPMWCSWTVKQCSAFKNKVVILRPLMVCIIV